MVPPYRISLRKKGKHEKHRPTRLSLFAHQRPVNALPPSGPRLVHWHNWNPPRVGSLVSTHPFNLVSTHPFNLFYLHGKVENTLELPSFHGIASAVEWNHWVKKSDIVKKHFGECALSMWQKAKGWILMLCEEFVRRLSRKKLIKAVFYGKTTLVERRWSNSWRSSLAQ